MAGKPTRKEMKHKKQERKDKHTELNKQVESALRQSEEEYRNLFNSIPDPVFIVQEDIVAELNTAIMELFGYDQQDIENGLSVYDVVDFKVKEIIRERIKKRFSGEKIIPDFYSFEVITKDGKLIPCEAKGALIQYKGKPAILSVLRDITERKRMEDELRKSEKKYRDLIDKYNAPITVFDRNNVTILMNHVAAENFFGKPEDFIGKKLSEYFPNGGYYTQRHNTVMESRRSADFEDEFEFPAGKKWYWSNLQPLKDENGEIYGLQTISYDITERKKTEYRIRDLTNQLIMSQENERQLISRELHDTVAQALSSSRIIIQMLLEDKSLTTGVRKKISEVSRSLHTTLQTVRDLSYELKPPGLEKFGLTKTLYTHCSDVIEKNGIKLNFNSAGMDNLKLNYDTKINIYRLIQEGLNNVKKHAEASRVNIKLVSSFPEIIIRIEDDGKGFDVNERLTNAKDEKHMGLNNMQERVRLLQGTMSIESIPDKGTKILIKIPYPDHVD